MSETFIQFKEITKTFGGVIALKDVTLEVPRGECHGLMGENGAGKSTLGKVLAGIHKPDSGELFIDGKLHSFNSPRDAMDAGVDMAEMERRAERLLSKIGVSLDVTKPMNELSTAQEQLVQIAAAVGIDPR